MSMTVGTVSVDVGGTATGSGCAKEIYDALVASGLPVGASAVMFGGGPGAVVLASMRALDFYAAIANSIATAMVGHIKANGQAQVSGSLGGLQKSTAAGSLTDPPGGLGVFIPIV